MILDCIKITNFGAYLGEQTAILTPDPGKPVVLFGGMNGGGKTTLLDALQLAFYGAKARISNRGSRSYKEYLRESINSTADPAVGASISLTYRRIVSGTYLSFEITRAWRVVAGTLNEAFLVTRDGALDRHSTDHWDEVVESYLPSSIAHLFFFDGEQIKNLAEGGHAAEILGTAVHSLLGLDLVERLDTDLKVFERRKRAEDADSKTAAEMQSLNRELVELERLQAEVFQEEGALTNAIGRAQKEVAEKEKEFRKEGGELFEMRQSIESGFVSLRNRRGALESRIRILAAGILPLQLVRHRLQEALALVEQESKVRTARDLTQALNTRDKQLLKSLGATKLSATALGMVKTVLDQDRSQRAALGKQPLILDAPEQTAPQLQYLLTSQLPAAVAEAADCASELRTLEEQIVRAETDLARVPTADRLAAIQDELALLRKSHVDAIHAWEVLKARRDALSRQQEATRQRLLRVERDNWESSVKSDDRIRILKHSPKVRATLEAFRSKVVKHHSENLQRLMLESFKQLLRKGNLVTGLTIDPSTFETTLLGREGKALSFDRLSAGERQLLATSMLWGLARASGRPIPTVIDTPLGRLDSEHRSHLVERYFPNASHQVLLLSTDEEIIGPSYETLKPWLTRAYLLDHDDASGSTTIKPGYFQ